MKTKKIFLSILVVLFVFIAIMVPASAAGTTGEMSFDTNVKTYYRGDRIEVTVSLQNVTDESGILGVSVDSIDYDSAVLTFESISAKSLPSGWTIAGTKAPLLIADDTTSNPTKSGLSVLLTFKVNENAEFKTTTISASGSGTNGELEEVGISFGEVSVSIVCNHKFDQKNTESKYMKSAATCKAKAVYYYSCSCGEKGTSTFEYGEYVSHTYGSWISEVPATCTETGTKGHYECSVCHKYFDAAKNEITDLTLSKLMHTYNQKKTDAMYLKSAATCKAKAVYYYSCSCGEKGTTTFEYGNLAAHTYKTTWTTDAKNHWHECSVCGNKKDEAAHTPGAAATETTAQVCTVCNYVITPALGHTHSFTKRVDERYLKSKATCTAKAVYYYSCSCGAIGNSTFEYGELAEHTAMYFWSNDRTGHWHECSTCGKKLDLSVHIPNRASATETEPVVCTVCGYLIEAAHGHIHNITGYWEKDEENHWHSCTGCDLRFDLENHVFTLVADKRNAGSSVIFGHEECVTCGLKKGSLLYGIEPGTTVEKLKKALGKDIVVNGAKNGLIGTGTQVVVGGKKYTVIIKGDTDGDGKITATDYIRVRLHILKRIRLDGEKLLAAHASTEIGKNVSAADYIAIRLHILKKKLIVQ